MTFTLELIIDYILLLIMNLCIVVLSNSQGGAVRKKKVIRLSTFIY